jgi:hypothetical protein
MQLPSEQEDEVAITSSSVQMGVMEDSDSKEKVQA